MRAAAIQDQAEQQGRGALEYGATICVRKRVNQDEKL